MNLRNNDASDDAYLLDRAGPTDPFVRRLERTLAVKRYAGDVGGFPLRLLGGLAAAAGLFVVAAVLWSGEEGELAPPPAAGVAVEAPEPEEDQPVALDLPARPVAPPGVDAVATPEVIADPAEPPVETLGR